MAKIFDTSLGNYLNKINNEYNNKDNKSITDILKSFSQISNEFNEFNENELNNNNNNVYSSVNYNECSDIEQEEFFSDQLQFIETLVTNNIYDKQGIIWNWGDIYNLMKDPTYKNTEKIKRKGFT